MFAPFQQETIPGILLWERMRFKFRRPMVFCFSYLVSDTFTEEGQYNFNILKRIEVTDSFLTIDKPVRGCQNEEPYDVCKTRVYQENLLKKCGCLPLSISFNSKVNIYEVL